MKPRPPTLRPRRRYILARIDPVWVSLETRTIFTAIQDAATALYGDILTARMSPAVVAAEAGHVIVRCRRGTERELATACATVTEAGGVPIAIRPRSTSGTIATLREKIPPCQVEEGEVIILDGREYRTRYTSRQKVDLSATGMTHQELLFFSTTDLEEK